MAVTGRALLFSPQEGYWDLLVDPVLPAGNVVRVFCFRFFLELSVSLVASRLLEGDEPGGVGGPSAGL